MKFAMLQYNNKMFDTVPDLAIVFVYVAIKHAIWEYKTRRQMTAEFEGNKMVHKCKSLVKVDIQSKLICEWNVQR